MSKKYKPGYESWRYHRLPPAQRAAVAREVDRRFREQTGVVLTLDSTAARDLELRRTWLRIRDAVIQELDVEETEELHRELLIAGDFPQEIADEMFLNGLKEAGQLLEIWGKRPAAIAPAYSAPVTNVIKMDWVLQFARAKAVYDEIVKGRIWTNPASQKRMAEVLKQARQPVAYFSKPVTVVDQTWINARPIRSSLELDALHYALGAFNMQVIIAGKDLSIGGGSFQLSVEEVGIYVKDSFDFNGSQFLGFWGYRDDPIRNEDFCQWRAENNAGGDFLVFSDVKRTKLSAPDLVKGRLL